MKARTLFLLILAACAIIGVYVVPAIPQDPAYHHFADQRAVFQIPNFWNVVSNLPFLLVGLLALRAMQSGNLLGGLPELRVVYWTFFFGVSAVAVGSGYYHWKPSNTTLVWDRLPMTITFMAFFCAIVGERIAVKAGRVLLLPMLLLGMSSVCYWYFGELDGDGDLRFYILVQFLPILLLPLILILYPPKLVPDTYLWGVLLLYGLSKLAELWDSEIFQLLGIFSGHAIKHILAASGTCCFLMALRSRHLKSVNYEALKRKSLSW